MLARNFKSSTDLGISDAELDALIKVLGMFERGEVVATDQNMPKVANGFAMSMVERKTDCGTARCILGWCRALAGYKGRDDRLFKVTDNRVPPGALKLFMYGDNRRLGRITTEQAATALRSYLSTGEPSWTEALAS